jgi:hypothetical protein
VQHGISRGSGPVVRSEEARKKELQQIADYKSLAELVNTKVEELISVSYDYSLHLGSRETIHDRSPSIHHEALEREPRILHNMESPETRSGHSGPSRDPLTTTR